MKREIFNKVKDKLLKSPGVYEFHDKKGEIIYIGKATNLRDRVKSYFQRSAHFDRPNIEPMILQIVDIKIHKTDSVLEALILESNLIKKYQPKYNIEGKDDKSFAYVIVTKERFPRVLIERETNIFQGSILKIKKIKNLEEIFGPYPSKKQLEIALKLIRKIFPFHSAKQISRNCCFDHQIGLCPGPYVDAINRKDYLKNIRGVKMILKGKKKRLIGFLHKEMKTYAKNHEFEKAAVARNQIFALKHIRDVALISNDLEDSALFFENKSLRIEAYDISNLDGNYATGSMVVFTGHKPNKSHYRKFKIRTVSKIDDVGMMREILHRRFQNNWPLPDLILVDGGRGHLNMTEQLLRELKLKIPVIAVAKGPTRKVSNFQFLISKQNSRSKIQEMKNIIDNKLFLSSIMNEAHRFAINYHKKLRTRDWRKK